MDAVSAAEDSLLDSLEELPEELKRSFAMIREKNSKCDSLMKAIDEKSDQYLESLAAANSDCSRTVPDDIVKMYDKLKKYSENNVQLATKTYELVDKYIQNLDVNLSSYEEKIKTGHDSGTDHKSSGTKKKAGRKSHANKKSNKIKDEDQLYAKQIKSPVEVEASIRQLINPSLNVSTESLDMPVDPNEPTYCLCNQVSYGDMVGCDNADCPIEWFHFACVGLTTNPRGKWYCPRCKDKKK